MNYAVSSLDERSESFLSTTTPTQVWNKLFSAYRGAYFGSNHAQGRNVAYEFNGVDFEEACREVVALTRNATFDDVLVLDVQLNSDQYNCARERLADVLFRAGYQVPLIWASRDVILR